MSVEYRSDRGCWTWRVYRYGKRHKGYGYKTKDEAKQAERAFVKDLEARPRLPATALESVATEVIALAQAKRSHSRAQGLCLNLERFILPYFGPATLITDVTPVQVEGFVDHHLARVKPMTVWHYVKDLRFTLNYAIKKGILDRNPVARADLGRLAKRRVPKPPLSQVLVDKQALSLKGRDRLYYDTLRFCGLRKDEGNSVQARDVIEADGLWLHIRGTKTAGSNRIIPLPPVLWEGYQTICAKLQPSDYVFGTRKGKPIYDRRKLFARAARDSGTPVLKPKDLRDYFASVMRDPIVASKMLGHTSLQTTGIYVRQLQERMLAGVQNLGANFGGQSEASDLAKTRENPQSDPQPADASS